MPQSDGPGPRQPNWSQYSAWRGPADGAWMTADEVLVLQLAAQRALRPRLRRWDFPMARPRAGSVGRARLSLPLLAAGADLGLLYLLCSAALLWLGSALLGTATQGAPLAWSEVLLCLQTLLVAGGYLSWRLTRLAGPSGAFSATPRVARRPTRSRPRRRRSSLARLFF